MKKVFYVLGGLLIAAVIALVSSLLTLHFFAKPAIQYTSAADRKMAEIASYLDAYFIDDYDPEKLEAAAADGAAASMIEATGDRWSYYISADEMKEYEEQMANAYVGVGITITMEDAGARIMEVVKDGPAAQAGILVEDLLTHVNGASTAGLTSGEVADMVAGEAGTDVEFTLIREDRSFAVSVTRAEIIVDVAVGEMLENGIGLVTIENFDAHCADQTLACVENLLKDGARALIFDVRFNGGGYKTEMTAVLDALVPEGVIFHSVDYKDKEEIIRSDADCLEVPMAVLVNADTYSAAEYFAAVLQEYEMAVIIGTQTVGKGNFQRTMPLSDGSAVAISQGKYFTPSGKSLTDIGVTPDQVVELDDEQYFYLGYNMLEQEEDLQLQAAIKTLSAKIS